MNKALPAPRMQLRWEADPEDPSSGWLCHYEMVLRLEAVDIRGEVYRGSRLLKKRRTELAVPIKEPTLRLSANEPCKTPDGKERFCDTPYRDFAHARWDAKQLGDLPIFVIAPDGMSFPVEPLAPEVFKRLSLVISHPQSKKTS